MIYLLYTCYQYLFPYGAATSFKSPFAYFCRLYTHINTIPLYMCSKIFVIFHNLKLFIFVVWLLTFFFIFTTFRSTIPRLRLDLLLDFFWKYVVIFSFVVLITLILYVNV